jgi:hypothetical protein
MMAVLPDEKKPGGTNYGLVLFLASIGIWVLEKLALKYSIAQESAILCSITLDGCLLINVALLGASIAVIVYRNRFPCRPSLWGAVVAGVWATAKLISLANTFLSN